MQLPKKVNIGGKVYTVSRDKNRSESNGYVNTEKRTIMVGAKNKLHEEAFNTFIHEVAEASLIQNCFRFNRDAHPDEFVYQMTHHEFVRFAEEVSEAIRPMMRSK